MNGNTGVKIPLLLIPSVAFEQIYEHLDFVDIINLASCSKKTVHMVKIYERLMRSTPVMDVVITNSCMSVEIRDDRHRTFMWSAHSGRDRKAAEAVSFMDIKVGGKQWTLSPYEHGWRKLGIESSDLIFWVKFLKDLFKSSISLFSVKTYHAIDYAELLTETNTFHKVETLDIGGMALDIDELAMFLDNVRGQNLKCKAIIDYGFEYTKHVNFTGNIHVAGNWISHKTFLSLNCKQLYIYGDNVDERLVQQYISQWLAGDKKTLEFLRFKRDIGPYNKSAILKSIDCVPGSRKRQDAAPYYDDSIEYHRGSDIRRSDGVLATLHVDRYGGQPIVNFVVWYDPNPNDDGSEDSDEDDLDVMNDVDLDDEDYNHPVVNY